MPSGVHNSIKIIMWSLYFSFHLSIHPSDYLSRDHGQDKTRSRKRETNKPALRASSATWNLPAGGQKGQVVLHYCLTRTVSLYWPDSRNIFNGLFPSVFARRLLGVWRSSGSNFKARIFLHGFVIRGSLQVCAGNGFLIWHLLASTSFGFYRKRECRKVRDISAG